jgi:hypothetical protein
MQQDVDLAETGQPMFITIAGREIVVMDAVAFRAMQDKAAAWGVMTAPCQHHWHDYGTANTRCPSCGMKV